MASRGGTCKEMFMAHATVSDYDLSTETMDLEQNVKPKKVTFALGVKPRVLSTKGVLDLFQCPVCSCSMYPPILQVSILLAFIEISDLKIHMLPQAFVFNSFLAPTHIVIEPK